MNIMNTKRILAICLALIIACVFALPLNTYASKKVNLNKNASVYIKVGVQNVNVDLYQVGDVKRNGEVVFKEEYKKYKISLDNINIGSNQASAQALETYLIRDNISPTVSKMTNQNGNVFFDNLEVGVYLISYERQKDGKDVTVFSPTLVSLPALLDDNNEYDLNANIKQQKRLGRSYCDIYKVWDTGNKEGQIPDDITVQLLRDGEVYDEQILNKENYWHYRWSNLDENHYWSVIEKEVPDGFTVGVEHDGKAYILTNTLVKDKEEVSPKSDGVESDKEKNKPEDKKLPQTGQLWWPVYALTAAGLFFILAGMWLNRKKRGM